MNVAVLSGGVGGARFLRGLLGVVDPGNVSIVGNVADDLEVLGLRISPDLDSILYTLTGLSDDERGWGRAGETWHALDTVARLGGESWFRLGDLDIGLHLVRTQLLREGVPLSEATERIAHALGLAAALLPATDDPLRTFIETPAGTFAFQTWFVARGHRDEVDAVHYAGSPEATPGPGVLDALRGADVIVIAPSNPYVSIGPILAIDEIRDALMRRSVPCVAISPLVGGRAVKGPADRMLARIAGGTTPAHVASCYGGLVDVLVVDERDAPDGPIAGIERTVVDADADDRPLGRATARGRGRARARGTCVKVAILGGTGSFGRALAVRLAALGEDDVVIGSRDEARARQVASELGDRVSGATNEDAVRGVDLAVLAVKADAALDTARAVAAALGDTPLLSVASAIEFRKGVGAFPDADPRSLAERVQDVVRAPVVAGLHSIAAANLDAAPPDEDALVCGDDADAKELALQFASKLVAGRPLDAGPLASARALEGLTAVIVNLNRRYKAHAGLRISGVE